MESRKEMSPRIVSCACLLVALVAWLYLPTFAWLYERYISADSYYSHGFLVPFVVGALIWFRRGLLQSIPFSSSIAGLALCCAALGMHLVGLRLQFHFASGFSLFFLIVGSVLFLFGGGITRCIAVPLLFLIFMLPLPLVAINSISFPLKMFVAANTEVILKHVCGLPMRIEGFQIIFPQAALTIENPCSGLRSIIVMLALGFVFAHLSEASPGRKALLFLLSIPVAVATNVLRVVLLGLAVYVYGEPAAKGCFHDFTGYLAFAAAFGMMYVFWRMFRCRH